MPLILGTNSIKDTGFDVANSARFQTASLKRSAGSKTNATQATISMWFKRSDLVDCVLMQSYTDDSNRAYIKLLGNTFYFFDRSGGTTRNYWVSTFVLRDISAWYHLHVNIDTGNGTAANRFIVHLNGVNQPVANFTNNASYGSGVTSNWQQASGTNQFTIGANENVNSQYFGGYMSEVVYLDGQVVAYDSFGEFDEDSGIWKPIDGLADLTVGNTGFYLDFEDSSDLGADVIGSNDFTATGLAAIDQSTDTCTNNFCTMNPLDNFYASSTFSEGNLKMVTGGTPNTWNTSTFGVSKGKWYCEIKLTNDGSGGSSLFGIADRPTVSATEELGGLATTYAYLSSGQFRTNNTNTANSVSSADGDIIGIALDLDSTQNTISYYKNGTLIVAAQNITAPVSGNYFIASGDWLDGSSDVCTYEHNFGSPSYSESGGNSDGNGYGNFAASVPSGYFCLNSKNLAEYG